MSEWHAQLIVCYTCAGNSVTLHAPNFAQTAT